MSNKTAIIYARVSDRKQADEELPIAGQLEQCRAKAAALGATVLRVFVDEGLSGRYESRRGFQDAVLYAETYAPDYLITWSTSRFARNRVDASLYKRRLQKAGTSLVYVTVDIDTSTDAGWLLDGILEIMDEHYSRQVAADTRRSLLKNAREGRWNGGRPPFGYEVVPDPADPKRRRLTPLPAEAAIARRIFELRAHQGLGARAIAILLNEEGHTNRGRRWNKTVIHALLRNEALIGRTVFGRRERIGELRRLRPRDQWIVVDSHEPIIPMELWDMVQDQLDRDAAACEHGSPNSQHVFTGLLYCGKCGARLHIESAKGRSARYWYYNCSAAMKDKAHPPRRLPAGVLDEYLIEVICTKIFNTRSMTETVQEMHAAAASWSREREERRRGLVAGLRSIEGKLAKLYEVLELYGKDAPNLGDLTHRLRQHNEERKRLEAEIDALDKETPPVVAIDRTQLRQLAEVLLELVKTTENPAKLRAFFASFIKGVTIREEKAEIVFYPQKVLNRHGVPVHSTSSWLPGTDVLGTKCVVVSLPAKLARVA